MQYLKFGSCHHNDAITGLKAVDLRLQPSQYTLCACFQLPSTAKCNVDAYKARKVLESGCDDDDAVHLDQPLIHYT